MTVLFDGVDREGQEKREDFNWNRGNLLSDLRLFVVLAIVRGALDGCIMLNSSGKQCWLLQPKT